MVNNKTVGDQTQHKITYFSTEVLKDFSLPERFTFPFYYEPHPLTKIAAEELQRYLETRTDLGLSTEQGGAGKMFGVLVVKDTNGRIGYLSGFSGKLAGANDHARFVPPVFDMLTKNSFFLKELAVIDNVNKRVKELSADETYIGLAEELERITAAAVREIADLKNKLKTNKENRKRLREEKKNALAPDAYALFEEEMISQSKNDKYLLKALTEEWKRAEEEARTKLAPLNEDMETLRQERKERSNALQDRLFDQYTFLNKAGTSKSLRDIFRATTAGKPPSAAGECATPKLLQYAFARGYEPLAMAEFWWGAPPESEIRKHKLFYPACTGKCKPILAHMLEGTPMDDDPFTAAMDDHLKLDIIYEDEWLVVVNKPAGLLSVPGIGTVDSVYSRLRATMGSVEPRIVHRLDMATSGLMVVAKTVEAYKHIQRQFLARTVSKRYTALLSRVIDGEEGTITLPLRPDLYNRPRQLVCYEHGKRSVTQWRVVAISETMTRVHFWPLTGRTHQLRVHAAHQLGLDAPIAGDELYGSSAGRLYLHAAYLSFLHPGTKEQVSFEVAEDF